MGLCCEKKQHSPMQFYIQSSRHCEVSIASFHVFLCCMLQFIIVTYLVFADNYVHLHHISLN